MKRKINLALLFIFCCTIFLSGCGQRDIGESKAKEIGLAYINKYFGADETEAEVTREQLEYFTYKDGLAVSGGDADGTRAVYHVRVANSETITRYEAWIVADSGNLLYCNQSELNIVLTDEQKEQANILFTEERNWGEKHEDALKRLKAESTLWVMNNLMEDEPILFVAETGENPRVNVTTTFVESYYVAMRNGTIYQIAMQWPSFQVLQVSMLNEMN